jgi:hypothetical protein
MKSNPVVAIAVRVQPGVSDEYLFLLLWGWSGRILELTTHLHLLLMFRMHGALRQSPYVLISLFLNTVKTCFINLLAESYQCSLGDQAVSWLLGCWYSICILQVLHCCGTTSVEAKLWVSCSNNNTGDITANHCDCWSWWETTCRRYVCGQPNCVGWAIYHTYSEARGKGYFYVLQVFPF